MSPHKSRNLAKDDAVWAASMHRANQKHQQFNWQVLKHWEETRGADPAEVAKKVLAGNGNELEKRLVASFCRWARKVAENLYFEKGFMHKYTPSQVVRSDMDVLEERAYERLVYLALGIEESRAILSLKPKDREEAEQYVDTTERIFNETYDVLLMAGLAEEERDVYIEDAVVRFSEKSS